MEAWRRAGLQFESGTDLVRIRKLSADTTDTASLVWFVSVDCLLHVNPNADCLPSITNYNIVVSVLSMFILLVKVVLFIMHMWVPIVSVIIDAIVIALWSFSAYGQAGPDHSDPEHPSSVAWYIAKSCSVAEASGNKHNCEMAKGAFASTIFMMYVFPA